MLRAQPAPRRACLYADPAFASIRRQLVGLWEHDKDCRDSGCRVPLAPSLQTGPAHLAGLDRHALALKRTYDDR